MSISPIQALKSAVEIVGSQSAMGRLLGVSQHAVWRWLNSVDETKPLPSEHVLAVEAATGVSRHDLRPDIYPRPEADGFDELHAAVRGEARP